MRTFLLVILLGLSFTCNAQRLSAELGFNPSYNQNAKTMVCNTEFTYLTYSYQAFPFFSFSNVCKLDTAGTILWDLDVNPDPLNGSEIRKVDEMILAADGGVYLLGSCMPTCDVLGGCFGFIQKINENGVTEWTKTLSNSFCNFSVLLSGLSIDSNNNLVVNYLDTVANAHIYTIDSIGRIIRDIPVSQSGISGFSSLSGFEAIAFKEDSLFAFDSTGVTINTMLFSSGIQNIKTLNDSLYVLTADSIFIFDINLNPLQASNVFGFSAYSNLKVTSQEVKFLSANTTTHTIITLNKQLQLQNTTVLPLAGFSGKKDFNDWHLSAGIDFPLTMHNGIRYLNYTYNSAQNTVVNSGDIGVEDMQVTQSTAQAITGTNFHYVTIWGTVRIKNYGNTFVNSCCVNAKISNYAICFENISTQHFYNLNLGPGDTTTVNFGILFNDIITFGSVLDPVVCAYTSYANELTDLDVSNDQFCKNLYVGTVSVAENDIENIKIGPNPVSNILYIDNPESAELKIYIVDLLGNNISDYSGKQNRFDIDLSNQSAGIYFVRIQRGNAVINRKIIKA